ncbi:V-set and immunoglobulin domain-containing protein 1-like isoform X2 [Antedon mediterranea]
MHSVKTREIYNEGMVSRYYIICYAVMLLVVVSAKKIKTEEEGGYNTTDLLQLHPVITSPAVSGPYEMVIGETLHLSCNVNKKVDYNFQGHRPIFMWWCNSTAKPCHNSSAPLLCNICINVTKSGNEANTSSTELTIEHVTKANTSTYTCIAFTDDDDYSASPVNISIQVIVHEKVKPKLTVTQSVIKTIGRFVELVCIDSVGYPTTSISWYKDSHFVHSGRLLRLDNVSHHDAGVYHCSAVNRFNRVNSSVILKVQDDISESFTKYNVIVGCPAALFAIIGISVWIYIRKVQEKRNCRCMSNPSQAENENLIN